MARFTHPVAIVRLGVFLLALATLLHAFEHWEVSALDECMARCEQTLHSSDSDSDAPHALGHNHGCSPHEHSPAVLSISGILKPDSTVLATLERSLAPPPALPQEIIQPPRIS